jgi:Fe-S-cluster-containing dehydrogenase component
MRISRRALLGGAAAAATTTALVGRAEARAKVEPGPEAVGMLFDSTRCIGCRACQAACKAANRLPADGGELGRGMYDAPVDLNGTTKNIVKAAQVGDRWVFVKRQCMHCVDPACVSSCMLGALHKEGEGPRRYEDERRGSGLVLYDKATCVGCRYCQIACPFNVPKFEWTKAVPLIVKCELCHQRAKPDAKGPLAVANPACCEACPREAVIYGYRAELLEDARRRIAAEPERYAPHVYGEREAGGTQVLYLAPAGVSFDRLGLPALSDRSPAQFSESVSHAPYLHGATPVAVFAAMVFLVRRNKRRQDQEQAREEGR